VAALDVERVFREFVRNANQVGKMARTVRADPLFADPLSADPRSTDADATARHRPVVFEPESDASSPILLTLKKIPKPVAGDVPAVRKPSPQTQASSRSTPTPSHVQSDASRTTRGDRTQRVEAALVVPDVNSIRPPAPPVPERAEDGQMPAGELDRQLTDMAVLLRYGHHDEVGQRLDDLLREYPEDLLLLKRVAQFHLETENPHLARECLFQLASMLFERRNLHGMRQALEQVLVIDPKSQRANKLLGLLEARPDDPS